MSAPASASTIFVPNNNGSNVYFQENPKAPGAAVRTLGHTFTVPAPGVENIATDFGFEPYPNTTFDYRFMVFLFDTGTSQTATGLKCHASQG